MNSEQKRLALYWVVTTPVLALMAFSAFAYWSRSPEVIAGITHLGYPPYLLYILGTAKPLGILAIVTGLSKTLKEWAYVGFTINLLGAAASHLFSGDGLAKASLPLAVLVLLLASYRLQKKSI
ncbi:MAG: DoxX family protein [Bdellovibrionota bacterium]